MHAHRFAPGRRSRAAEIAIESVGKTPLPGIYEVFANGQLLYTDEKAGYLFVNGIQRGTIYDDVQQPGVDAIET